MKKNIILALAGMIICLLMLTSPAAALDDTLCIFGNANEDDTINMQDVTYTELIILEFKYQTQFADAKYDGEVDILDVTQIELIILGREKELTFVDQLDRIVTISKPVEKVVCMHRAPEHLVAIGAKDRIAGAVNWVISRPELVEGAGLIDIPDVGSSREPNYELILEIMPDLVFAPIYDDGMCAYALEDHLPDEIPIAGIDFYIPEPRFRSLRTLGYIVDKEDEAGELVNWFEEYLEILTERTKDLDPDEKPTVLYIKGNDGKIETNAHGVEVVELYAGGRNIAYEIVPPEASSAEVSNEWILEQDPDVIFVHDYIGWEASSEDAGKKLDEFVESRPGWDKLSAVVNGRIYLTDWDITIHRYAIGACYIAKCLHPELFEDLDPEELHREYFERFMGFDVQGVWMYPAAPV